jgi:hypothetical protein
LPVKHADFTFAPETERALPRRVVSRFHGNLGPLRKAPRHRSGGWFAWCCLVDAATFVVTSVGDSGAGSLRQAILNANASAGDDTILFQLPPSLSAPFDRARVCLAESEQQRGDRE